MEGLGAGKQEDSRLHHDLLKYLIVSYDFELIGQKQQVRIHSLQVIPFP